MLSDHRVIAKTAWVGLALLMAPLVISSRAADKLDLSLDGGTEVVLDGNRNGMPAKTKLISTTSYNSYSLAPVVDGNKQRTDLGWAEAAWASDEEASTHGIEIQFSQPQRGGRFQVTWAYDTNGDDKVHWWVSREFVIQVKAKAGDAWKTVVDVKNNQSVICCYPLPDASFSFLRICQPAGGGNPSRPNLMWVGQVELLKD
jgi:hypothetical protein